MHGLIFETSISRLAGSTRYPSTHDARVPPARSNEGHLAKGTGNTPSIRAIKLPRPCSGERGRASERPAASSRRARWGSSRERHQTDEATPKRGTFLCRIAPTHTRPKATICATRATMWLRSLLTRKASSTGRQHEPNHTDPCRVSKPLNQPHSAKNASSTRRQHEPKDTGSCRVSKPLNQSHSANTLNKIQQAQQDRYRNGSKTDPGKVSKRIRNGSMPSIETDQKRIHAGYRNGSKTDPCRV